jgi:hypothetical protein
MFMKLNYHHEQLKSRRTLKKDTNYYSLDSQDKTLNYEPKDRFQ